VLGTLGAGFGDGCPRLPRVARDATGSACRDRSFDGAEAALTEVPDHLLQRSRARRAALGLGGEEGAAPAPVPATAAEESTPEAPAAATPAPVVEPEPALPAYVPPHVQTAKARKKIPFWAVPVVAFTPIWVFIFALTLDEPTPTEPGPLALGAEVYGQCAACHGGGGGGGVGPALSGGAVVETFPDFADQVRWVMEGTAGFQALGIPTYGATDRPVGSGGNMPGWKDSLTPQELLAVVRHEREVFGGEEFDPAVYDETLAMIEADYPDQLAEWTAAVDEFAALPPDS
jgi:mono/diheme cytochrome c family protein